MDRDQVEEIVYTFAKEMKYNNIKICGEVIEKLTDMSDEDAVEYLISLASKLVKDKKLKIEDIRHNMSLLIGLSKNNTTNEIISKKLELLKKNHLK